MFRNEIVWRRSPTAGHYKMISNSFALNNDTIFLYTKTTKFTFNKPFIPFSKEYIDANFKLDDGDGKGLYTWMMMVNPSEKTIERMKKENRFLDKYAVKSSKYHGYKVYLSSRKGHPVETIWNDIPGFGSMSKEREVLP